MRATLLIVFIVLTFFVFSLQCSLISESVGLVGHVVVSEGESIQAAINSAAPGDTIFVKNGTYSEQILVNKSVSLIGESILGVILDGKGKYTYMVNIIADDVRLEQFTIRNASSSFGSTIIHVLNRRNVTIQNCKIEIGFHGVLITNSRNCKLFNNTISRNNAGIKLHSNSEDNTLNGNFIFNNTYGTYIDTAIHNLIFHNNFINNTHSYWTDTSKNYWDNNYPFGGNYWSDYSGLDQNRGPDQNITGSDGLGDSPYPYKDNPLDNFPYINPISIELYSYNNYTHYFLISSNLTILDFNFHAENETFVKFFVKGINGTQCSCRVMIPLRLLLFNSTERWIININSDSITPLLEEEADNFFLHFCFNLGQEIEMVRITPIYAKPKFNPNPLIFVFVTLVLVVLVLGIMFYVRRRYQHK
jgi:parallel beta-helix repeat protein